MSIPISQKNLDTSKIRQELVKKQEDEKQSDKSQAAVNTYTPAVSPSVFSGVTALSSPVSGDVGSLLNGSSSNSGAKSVGDTIEIARESTDISDIDMQAASTEDKGVLQNLWGKITNFFVGDAENVKQGEQVVADKTAAKDSAEAGKTQAEQTAQAATAQAETDKAKAEQAAAEVTAQEATVAENQSNFEASKAAYAEAQAGVRSAEANLEAAQSMPSATPADAAAKAAAVAEAEAALAAAKAQEEAAKAKMDSDEAILTQSKAKLETLKGVKTAADATAEKSEAFKIDADLKKTLMTNAFTSALNSVNTASQQLAQAVSSTSAQKEQTQSAIEEKLQEQQNQLAREYAYANTFGATEGMSASELVALANSENQTTAADNNTLSQTDLSGQNTAFGLMTKKQYEV